MRSRVTANDWPTSSRVCSLPSTSPKRILITFSSRWVSVRRTLFGFVLEVHVDRGFGRRNHGAVFDEVAEMRIFFFADWRFEGDRLLRDLGHFAHFRHRNIDISWDARLLSSADTARTRPESELVESPAVRELRPFKASGSPVRGFNGRWRIVRLAFLFFLLNPPVLLST